MKKKILLITLMVALLACLFIISASAIEYDKTETVTVTLSNGTTQQCALYDNDGDALVWYTTDSGATVVSVKTKDLYSDTNGAKLVESTNLTHIYLDAETPLQMQNNNTTNLVVVANLRDCTFAGIYHSGYKTTFSNSTIVQYVYLPSTVEALDCNSFQSCSNLKVCDFPSDASFTINSANNFNSCTSLTEINLIGCTQIKGSICHSNFSNCKALTKVILDPATITWPSIGGNEFNGCPLTQFGLIPGECTIPASTTSIGDNGFKYSNFTKVNLASSQLKTIGYNAFESNPNLTEISFPTTLTSMNVCVFMNCPKIQTLVGFENTALAAIPNDTFYKSGLTTVTLPSTCTTIGMRAFADDGNKKISALTSVTIPAGFVLIDDYAFQNCIKLETVTFLGNSGQNAVIDQAAFENCYSLPSIVIPEGVTTLGNCAVKNCTSLQYVKFPTTLTTLNGGQQFYGCSSLTTVVGLENTKLTCLSSEMFRGIKTWKPEVLRLPNTCKILYGYAIADIGVQTLYLGASFEKFDGNNPLTGCSALKTIYAPASAQTIPLGNSGTTTVFVTTSDATAIAGIKTSTGISNTVTYEEYSANPSNYTGKYIITGLNVCDTFYNGIHELDPEQSNACAGICAKCGEISQSANPEHELSITITYADFTTAGKRVTVCTHENCALKTTPNEEALEAIFAYVGFSLKADNSGSICIGYTVNDTAKAEYEMYNSALEIGVVGYIPVANESPLTVVDGKAAASEPQYTIQADITSQTFTAFDFVIAGFGTNTDVNLVMCAYVCDGTNVYYLNIDQTTNEVAQSTSATTFSYDGLNAYRVANEK